jgi:hypothetical protein
MLTWVSFDTLTSLLWIFTISTGQDDECLGGWSQHNRYGFAQTEQAYTEERYCIEFYTRAVVLVL